MTLALLATLGAVVVAFVLYPVFATAPAGGIIRLDDTARALSDLGDKKVMLYEAIQDLDFEKEAGKVSDADYETARNDYLAQVATVMAQMDAIAPETPPAPDTKPPKKKRQNKKKESELECASCGETNPKGSKFCLECGAAFRSQCTACGEDLPAKARFCNACGEKVSA